MARISRKELKRDEFVEATKEAEHWLQQHWQIVAKVAAGVAVVALIVAAWFWYTNRNREKAAVLLSDGLRQYEQAESGGFSDAEQLEAALANFDRAARKGGRASVGLVASYYRGISLHRLGRDEEALAVLEETASDPRCPSTLAGSAKASLADVLLAVGEAERAIQTLQELIDADPATYPVDQALLELGKIHRARGDEEQARLAWNRIVDEFPVRGTVDEARRLLGQ